MLEDALTEAEGFIVSRSIVVVDPKDGIKKRDLVDSAKCYPTDNIGRRIKELYDARGFFSPIQQYTGLMYYQFDFERITRAMQSDISVINNTNCGDCYDLAMRRILRYSRRILDDISHADCICGDRSKVVPLFHQKLPEHWSIFYTHFQNLIHLQWEFPDSHEQLIPLHFELDEAVRQEHYEVAHQKKQEILSYLDKR